MRIFKITLILLLSFLVASAGYSLSCGATDDKLLQLQISNLGPTRIALDNQKIQDAFFYPEEAVKLIIHQSGSVFVVPNDSHKHVYLTMVGEQGGIQDVRLKFVTKQPEPVKIYFTEQYPQSRVQNTTKQEGQNNAKKD